MSLTQWAYKLIRSANANPPVLAPGGSSVAETAASVKGPLRLEVLFQFVEELTAEYVGIVLRRHDGSTETFTFRAIMIRLATLTKKLLGGPVAPESSVSSLSTKAFLDIVTHRVDVVLEATLPTIVEKFVAAKLDEMGIVPAPKISYGDYIHKRGMFSVSKKTQVPVPSLAPASARILKSTVPGLSPGLVQKLAEPRLPEVQMREVEGYRFFTYGTYTWLEKIPPA